MAHVISIAQHPARCADCRHASDCPLLDEHAQVSESAMHGRVRVLHHGDRLIRGGDRVSAVYRVRTGVVKTSLTGTDGEEQVTGFFGPGEWVGLDAMDGAIHRSDAVALDTTSVCIIPFATLRERLAQSPRAARVMMDAMTRRLVNKEAVHLSLAKDNAAQRVAGFLLEVSDRRAAAGLDSTHLALPMSRGEIASYLALAVETVSRLLTRLHRSGVIEVHRHHVELLDRDALCRTAGHESPGRAARDVSA